MSEVGGTPEVIQLAEAIVLRDCTVYGDERLLAEALLESRAEVERLRTWAGIMAFLDEQYPADVFDGSSGDSGPRIVVLMREVERLTAERDDLAKRGNALQAEYVTALARVAALTEALRHYMQQTCPCGARNDALDTHPHVIGCPVGAALPCGLDR